MRSQNRWGWVLLGVLGVYLLGSQGAPQQCTAIAVPESINLAVWANGTRTAPPIEISTAFQTIMNTVELPRGYKAVGGGPGVVIACN